MTPLTKLHTMGRTFIPPGFHAGGMFHQGRTPRGSHLGDPGLPETTHRVKGAVVEALRCKAEGKSETILLNLCGHGHFDMAAYSAYFAGNLTDPSYSEEELAMALSGLRSVFA